MNIFKSRLPLPILLGSAVALASAQSVDTVIKPYKQISTGPAVVMSTSDFSPQINTQPFYTEKPLTPNSGLPTLPTGPSNSLKAGNATTKALGKNQAKFPAVGFTGWVPPDPDMGVGPDHIVAVVNSDIAFFTKSTGVKTFQQNLNGSGFFSGLGVQSGFTFDPKCFFDRLSQRFFVIICEQDDASQVSKMLVAVSDDANPAGTWFKYRIETKATEGSNNFWLDYPGFGYNKDAILFTGNMFPFASGGVFTQAIVIPKAPLLTGGTATAQYLKDATMFTVQPARTPDASQTSIYGATALNSTTIRLVAFTNLTGTPSLIKKDVSVPSWARPDPVPTGGSRFLDGLDGRLYTCHFRGGRLVTAHTTKAGDGRMKARWYEFNVNTWPASGNPALKQAGDILLSGTNSHMPAINTNAAGDISVIYSRNNSSTNPETCQSSRFATDALNTIGAPVSLVASTGIYGGGGVNRWGDYFACEVDPTDNLTFWGISMVTGAGGSWQTHINKWSVSSGSAATLIDPTAVATIQGNFVFGDLSAVTASDNTRYAIQSYLIDKNGAQTSNALEATAQVASLQADFTLDLSGGPLIDLKAVVEANVSATGPAGQVFAFNWTTNTFVSVGSFALSTTDKTVNVSIPKAQLSKYVNGSGNVKLQIRSISSVKGGRPGKIPPQYNFNIDRVALAPAFGS